MRGECEIGCWQYRLILIDTLIQLYTYTASVQRWNNLLMRIQDSWHWCSDHLLKWMFPHKDHIWKSQLSIWWRWDRMWPLGGWEATVFISVSESVSVFGVDVLRRRSGWVYEGETGGDPGALGANWPIWTHRAPPSRTPLCNHLCPGEQITCSCAQFQRAQNFAIHSNTMGSSNVCNQPSCKTHVAVPSITGWTMLCYDSNHTDDKMAAVLLVNSIYTFFVICDKNFVLLYLY